MVFFHTQKTVCTSFEEIRYPNSFFENYKKMLTGNDGLVNRIYTKSKNVAKPVSVQKLRDHSITQFFSVTIKKSI